MPISDSLISEDTPRVPPHSLWIGENARRLQPCVGKPRPLEICADVIGRRLWASGTRHATPSGPATRCGASIDTVIRRGGVEVFEAFFVCRIFACLGAVCSESERIRVLGLVCQFSATSAVAVSYAIADMNLFCRLYSAKNVVVML